MERKKEEISAAVLEKEIIDFLMGWASSSGGKNTGRGCNLKHGRASVLATSYKDIPRATPIDYFCDGTLSVWFNAEPGGKIANIMRNPNVSVGIYEPVDHTIDQKSLQLWGQAEIITEKKNPELFHEKWESFGVKEAVVGMVNSMIYQKKIPAEAKEKTMENIQKKINFIKVTPEKIVLREILVEQGTLRKVWENGKAWTLKFIM